MTGHCGCGCGKAVTNPMQECFPVLPWDPPGLPPRAKDDRCARHSHCAYRDDDETRCTICHGKANCTCEPQWKPKRRQSPRKGRG